MFAIVELHSACFFLLTAIVFSTYGKDNSKTASQKTLKEAYAGKFLIGTADDLTSNNEAYQQSIRTQYDIVTPENCMKPQPIHPSEDTYNFKTTDAMVEWCQKNGLKVSITELDVTATGDNSGAFSVTQGARTIPAENYQKQAEVYKKLFEIFMRHSKVIDRVTFWGLSDTRSWRRGQDALLFDGQLNPKPAYKAVIEAVKKK